MATKKFKKNLMLLMDLFDNIELVDFLCEKNAFSEHFMMLLTETKKLENIKDDETITDVKQKLKDYVVSYNKKNKKYVVDITKNEIFSFNDTEEDLIKKMKNYLDIEDYERANILNKYLKKLEIDY
jgi:hypothetical protein